MKRVLLDTHAFLWFVFDDPRLSAKAAATIESAEIEKHLSIASLWEITIKSQLNKLKLGMPLSEFFDAFVTEREIDVVNIDLYHLLAYEALPLHHRDPFDRLITATAQVMHVPIVSADPFLSKYDVSIIW